MPTIHDDIEPWLAAAVHDELSAEERAAFDAHLATCAACRALHQEEINMSKAIENTFAAERPDGAFEQRVLSGFRRSVPRSSGGVVSFFSHLLHARATQITAVAAVLLGLVQIGRIITPEEPAAGLLQLPSFVGTTVTENDSAPTAEYKGGSPDERKRRARNSATAAQKTGDLPVTVYSANVLQQQGSNAPAPAAPPAAPPPQEPEAKDDAGADAGAVERVVTTGSYIPTPAQESATAATPDTNRKLIRNAQVEIEVVRFDEAFQKITALVTEDRGFVATSSSQKQANGKLRGEVVVKVLPETLDAFLLKLRGLGEVKNQTVGTDDVTKEYFDTDSRLKNARVMEQRLIEILKTKSNKVADLLEVEKELGRVREQIEQMQGALKFMDAQVQFATVTITLAEKDMDLPAAFLLKRRARLALFSTDVEKTFAEVKSVVEGAKAQVSSSTLDRDSTGEATARLVLLIVPEEADALIERIKGMGRVQNYNEQTDRVAQGGTGMAENAKVERDKVELSITISRNEQEPALQTTSLRILTSAVTEKVARLKENAAKSGAEIRSSSFSRNPDGQETAHITLRVAMKNYPALLSSFDQLGKVKDVSVHREDRRGIVNEETAPADISIQVYSEGRIVSDDSGIIATIRHTLGQGAAALMWSLRMIGVAIAFLAPWAFALALIAWVVRRVSQARKARAAARDEVGE